MFNPDGCNVTFRADVVNSVDELKDAVDEDMDNDITVSSVVVVECVEVVVDVSNVLWSFAVVPM